MTSDRKAEIERIEGDLAILESRRAAMELAGKRIQVAFLVFLAALAATVILGMIVGHPVLILVSTTVMVIAAILGFFHRNVRPIELGLQGIGYFGIWRKSESEAVEEMIAERTTRLAELRGGQT